MAWIDLSWIPLVVMSLAFSGGTAAAYAEQALFQWHTRHIVLRLCVFSLGTLWFLAVAIGNAYLILRYADALMRIL